MPAASRYDAIIVGAGVAGLTALQLLDRAGLRAVCLEARDRIGGRVYTVRDALTTLPVELGAEFIHGRPAEIWDIAQSSQLTVYSGHDSAVYLAGGQVQRQADSWDLIGKVLDDMQAAAEQGRDQSFREFLDGTAFPDDAKQSATGYVEGFNAARAERVSIQSLAADAKAAEQIDGERVFRFAAGYDAIPLHILRSVPTAGAKLRLNTVVESIRWQSGDVSVRARNSLTGQVHTFDADRVIITVPLGVLQADPLVEGAIQFQPEPITQLEAARTLCFGQVFRAILRFREAFWESKPGLADTGFLLSQEPVFPTWWTPLAIRAPIITGWSAGPHADPLQNQSRLHIIAQASSSLGRITNTSLDRVHSLLEAAYFHDWHADPYSRGAYSYVPVGGTACRARLAEPVEETLYFAGEATELTGHSATVHGAIKSGRRVAEQVIASTSR